MLAIGLGIAIALLAIAFSASRLFSSHVEHHFHEELVVHLHELTRLVDLPANGHIRLLRPLSDPRFAEARSGYYWQVSSPTGELLRSPSLAAFGPGAQLDETLARSPEPVHDLREGPTGTSEVYGLLRYDRSGRPVHFIIGTDARFLLAVRHQFDRDLVKLMLGFALVFAVAMWLAIRFALRPLDQLSASVGAVRRGEADGILGRFPSEIVPLVDNLNALLRETNELVGRGRREAGQLAHSLRTALAVIQDEAESSVANADNRSETMLAQIAAMRAQIDWHLARARSGADSRLTGATADLGEAMEPVVRAMRRLHPDRQVTLATMDGLAVSCDPADFREIFGSLLDNAMRHADGAVAITAGTSDDKVIIAIDSRQAALLPDDPTQCFEIGFSGGGRSTGLGLPLARDLARHHGGEVMIGRCPDHTECVRASLTLPWSRREFPPHRNAAR